SKYTSVDTITLQPVDLSGQPFTNFPSNMVNMEARYHLPVDKKYGDPSVSLNFTWQSKTYFGLVPNDVGAPESPYGDLGARFDWNNVADTGIDAGFFVTNLTNRVYRLGSFTIYTSLGLVTDVFAPPRMYGFELRYRWNP